MPVEDTGRFVVLPPGECRQVLADHSVGRIGWVASAGLTVLPVVYGLIGDDIVFRTSAHTQLAELNEPTEVAFEVDDLDFGTRVGWSIVVRGMSAPYTGDTLPDIPAAWAPGERPLFLRIRPTTYSGRAVAAAERVEA